MNKINFHFKAMGSPCEITLYYSSRKHGKQIAHTIMEEVVRLEKKYSRYLTDSVTTTINRQAAKPGGITIDEETARLLDYAEVCYQQSDGLFDITSGLLRKLWNFSTHSNPKQSTAQTNNPVQQLPTQAEIDNILENIGWQKVSWQKPVLYFPSQQMEIDFGGIVKEYAADSAARICHQQGVKSALINLSGDIHAVGSQPDNEPWHIGIRDPFKPTEAIAHIPLHQGGLASSGDYERFVKINGKPYSHIMNPITGWPVQGLKAVSTVAEQCIVAGSASTVAMLKGDPAGIHWLEELGLAYLCVTQSGEIKKN